LGCAGSQHQQHGDHRNRQPVKTFGVHFFSPDLLDGLLCGEQKVFKNSFNLKKLLFS
jgi:hypothetical protein